MKVISLQSGSNGNCLYVEAGDVHLLVDAGISGRQAERRLAGHGRDIRRVDALLISHDHADHIRCAGVYQRKFGLPIYATDPTFQAIEARRPLGLLSDVRHFAAGQRLRFGAVTVETVPTAHDGVDGVAFVVDDGRRRLGILTDLGHVFDGLAEVLGSLDAVVLESNYDPDMLAGGSYPAFLKRRIAGDGGHLSNAESAELVRKASCKQLQWACLGHLSEENNTPRLALDTHRSIVGDALPIHVAGRYAATDVMEV